MSEKLTTYARSIETCLRGKQVGILYAETSDAKGIVRTTREDIASTLGDIGIATLNIEFLPDEIDELSVLIKAIKEVDVVCKVVHGRINRLGFLQGLMDLLEKPFTGHVLKTDLMSQDKLFGKGIMMEQGINTPRWIRVTPHNTNLVDTFVEETSARQFVIKPVGTNSSKGILFAESPEELMALLMNLPAQYGEYFVEEFIPGRVVTMGVIPCGDSLYATPPLEYVLGEGSTLMDEAWKTNPTRVSAENLNEGALQQMNRWSKLLHQGISAKGITRSDFIVDRDDNVFALEINSNVGLSRTHDVPMAAAIAGVQYSDLVLAHLGTADFH